MPRRGVLSRLVLAVALGIVATTAAHAQKTEDVIYLKDGRVFRGTIVEQLPNAESLLLRTQDDRYLRLTKAEIDRIVKAPVRSPGEVSANVKSPGLAWFLSFLVTGLGQAYNDEWWKTAVFLGVGTVGGVLYISEDPDACALGADCSQRTIGALIAVAAWIGSQIDAPVSAHAINQRSGLSLQLRPQPHRLGVSLATLRF